MNIIKSRVRICGGLD